VGLVQICPTKEFFVTTYKPIKKRKTNNNTILKKSCSEIASVYTEAEFACAMGIPLNFFVFNKKEKYAV